MNEEIKSMKTCPGCDKHCPVGQFACGKGCKLFGQIEENAQTAYKHNESQERMAGKEHRRGFHNHDRRSRSDHEEHCRHHDKKWWNKENNHDLTAVKGRCATI